MRLGRVALLVSLLAGCSGSTHPQRADPWVAVRSEKDGFEVSMPARPEEKRVREGPVRAHLFSSHDADGATYEVACFEMPEPLDDAERRHLMEQVQAGLTGAPGSKLESAREVSLPAPAGEPASDAGAPPAPGASGVELVIRRAEPAESKGTWWILYVGERRMVQVSAVGPLPGARGAERFLGSFRVLAAPPTPSP